MTEDKIAYLSPFKNDVNRFTEIIAEDMRELGYKVSSLGSALLKDWTVPRGRKVIIFNWFEDRLAWSRSPAFEFVRSVAVILVIKARVGRLIWIRHNLVPHDNGKSAFLDKCFRSIIRRFVDVTVTLRPHTESDFVLPHPLYAEEAASEETIERIDRCILFGSVRASKGITDLLEIWPPERELIILGRCGNNNLAERISTIIQTRGLRAIHENRFLADSELNEWLSTSKYAVIPHKDSGAMVSGTFYHAAGLGMNILITPGSFCEFLIKHYSFITPITASFCHPTPYVAPAIVRDEIRATNSDMVRKRVLASIVE